MPFKLAHLNISYKNGGPNFDLNKFIKIQKSNIMASFMFSYCNAYKTNLLVIWATKLVWMILHHHKIVEYPVWMEQSTRKLLKCYMTFVRQTQILGRKSLAVDYHKILFIKCKLECPKDVN